MLSGRKPPFRLLVKAVSSRGQPISIRHAVSEGFVVATRRTRTAGKVRGRRCREREGVGHVSPAVGQAHTPTLPHPTPSPQSPK